jgi:hypothetical protein
LRKLFETVVARCMEGGIVGGEAFAVDASMIVADAATALEDTVVRRRHYGRPPCANSGHC